MILRGLWNWIKGTTPEEHQTFRNALAEMPVETRVALSELIRELLNGEVTLGMFWERWDVLLGERKAAFGYPERAIREFLEVRADPDQGWVRFNDASVQHTGAVIPPTRWSTLQQSPILRMKRMMVELLADSLIPKSRLPIPASPHSPARELPRVADSQPASESLPVPAAPERTSRQDP